MRHRKKGKKFNRITNRRRSFLRGLVCNLIKRGLIETTEARAKAIRPITERLVSIAKKQNLSSRRIILSRLHNKFIVKKICEEVAPRYLKRDGGYLRITKLSKSRKRDGSGLAKIEFV